MFSRAAVCTYLTLAGRTSSSSGAIPTRSPMMIRLVSDCVAKHALLLEVAIVLTCLIH